MTIYQTNDGEKFEATDATDLIGQMRQVAFKKEDDVRAFMAKVAETVTDMTGYPIGSGSPEELVDDLIKTGYLKVVGQKDAEALDIRAVDD